MINILKNRVLGFSQAIGLVLISMGIITGCTPRNETPNIEGETFLVDLTFSGFETRVRPITSGQADEHQKNFGSQHHHVDEFPTNLYYWSFDAATLISDYYHQSPIELSLFPSWTTHTFLNGFPNTSVSNKLLEAGAVGSFILPIPVSGIRSLDKLSFEMGLSKYNALGIELEYSFSRSTGLSSLGKMIKIPKENLGFIKNTLAFDLSEITFQGQDTLYLFLSVNRGQLSENKNFTQRKSAVRIDNIRVSGMRNVRNEKLKNDLHYVIFDQKSNLKVSRGKFDVEKDAQSLRVELPFGEYSLVSIYNNSVKNPFLPEVIGSKNDFYLLDSMEVDGRIFGSIDTFKVDRSFSKKLELHRAYSQVRFEFTDTLATTKVTQLRVYPNHQPFAWNPYSINLPSLDAKPRKPYVIDINMDREKTVVFNEFLGLEAMARDLKYKVEVMEEEKVLRTFEVQGSVLNNMQLVFKGPLLPPTSGFGGFEISLKEKWTGEKVITFDKE